MDIELDLSKHCIETELKRLHNKSVSQYFKSGTDPKLEKQIEIITKLLEQCDFARLRSMFPELAGNQEIMAELKVDKNDRIIIFFNGRTIDPFNMAVL